MSGLGLVKAVTSSHECMHHGAGVLIQTPPKNPLPRCGELLGLSQLLVTPSLSTHQWVRIRFRGWGVEIGRLGLLFMHLNNASMFKNWPHGWEVIGFSCAWSGAGFLVCCFHLVICENLLKWLLWICGYLIITCLISSIASLKNKYLMLYFPFSMKCVVVLSPLSVSFSLSIYSIQF